MTIMLCGVYLTLIYSISNDTSNTMSTFLTPLNYDITLGVLVTTWLITASITIILFRTTLKGDVDDAVYWIIATFLLAGLSIAVVFMSPQYYDDCSELLTIDASYNNLNIYACIDYATEHPDATGAEIIQVLKPEKIISILDRPLNP